MVRSASFPVFFARQQEDIDADDEQRQHGQNDDECDADRLRTVVVHHIRRDDRGKGGVLAQSRGVGAVAVVKELYLRTLGDDPLFARFVGEADAVRRLQIGERVLIARRGIGGNGRKVGCRDPSADCGARIRFILDQRIGHVRRLDGAEQGDLRAAGERRPGKRGVEAGRKVRRYLRREIARFALRLCPAALGDRDGVGAEQLGGIAAVCLRKENDEVAVRVGRIVCKQYALPRVLASAIGDIVEGCTVRLPQRPEIDGDADRPRGDVHNEAILRVMGENGLFCAADGKLRERRDRGKRALRRVRARLCRDDVVAEEKIDGVVFIAERIRACPRAVRAVDEVRAVNGGKCLSVAHQHPV